MKNLTLLLAFVAIFCGVSHANNIEVKNISITGQNKSQHFSLVKFDLSWENSWRLSVGPSNWDAAWVFIKFRVNGGDWAHAKLNYVDGAADGHTVPSGATIRTSNDGLSYGLGAFIYRSADGSGDVNYQNVQLRWNYGENGVSDGDLVDVQVFALEMVYIPQGAFDLGGVTGQEENYFYTFPTQTSTYNISSENAISVGNSSGNLYYSSGGGDQLGPIPTAFPKGYKSFYCMKYEMSQDQWVSFFNTLTDVQKTNRDITDANHKNSDAIIYRNAVSWNGSGDATTSLPNVPVTYFFEADALAYLDWAALRPMTELEFEKTVRGPLPYVVDGYAWGTNRIFTGEYNLINEGTPSEQVANPAVGKGNSAINSAGGSGQGLVRCGIFAASAINKNREETGGSYYGVMELTGNIEERMVSVGNPVGRAFTGLHGNGNLTNNGNYDVPNWAIFGYVRGGNWLSDAIDFDLLILSRPSPRNDDYLDPEKGPFRAARTAD